jgi:ribosomal protein L7Ae-like RNA K-turn-binding protein
VGKSIVAAVLRLVGLGVRSRGVVVGVEQVREAAKKGRLVLALVAADASEHSVAKVVPLLEARQIPVEHLPSAAELGQAVGREQTAAVGIVDVQLAKGITQLLDTASDGSLGEGVRIE